MTAALEVESAKKRPSTAEQAATLAELFEVQAELSPEGIAVECGSFQMTYRELDQATNQLASYLRALGAGPEETVAFWLPRSKDVYVALLGILKAGAAYVPLDSEYPTDRVTYILNDSRCKIIVTTSEYSERLADFSGTVILLDRDGPQIAMQSLQSLTDGVPNATSENLCYVIYTSGSTGKPKGVQIEHRSAVHLVKTEAERFALRPDDRIYQGFSIAFDASVEEVWLAWCAGATLVAALPDMVHAGPDLPRLLTEKRITVLSCVPTLLAMMEGELLTVRILIVGGEACSADLVKRWCVPGRRMFNTYGPTEATVIATWAECEQGTPVTIGEPLPGYSAFVLDEHGHELLPGQIGELYLGGMGLARGYVGRDDLTQDRFVFKTLGLFEPQPQRFYRTGDLTRWTSDGQLEFCGRADGQIKLRGFRVELSEIESELLRCENVRAAAATVWEDNLGVQELVAYVVPKSHSEIDDEQLRQTLRQVLPVYMIPSHIEPIETLPTLTSGKVDRKRLPAPKRRAATPPDPRSKTDWVPTDDLEKHLATVWNEVFLTNAIGPNDDFFTDLGGHSLLAARMVSALRKTPRFASLSMLDVYHHPTITKLADCQRNRNSASTEGPRPVAPAPTDLQKRDLASRHRRCVVVQFIALYFIIGFFSLQWLAPYLTYTFLLDDGYTGLVPVLMSLATLVALYPVMLVLSIIVKWTVIGRIKPGRYPLWGSYFLRWWFVQAIRNIVPTSYLTGTPLLTVYYRLMGAKIGANVYLGNDGAQAFDLLSIGDDSCLGADSHFTCATIEDGWLILDSIEIGQRCFVGTRAVLRPRCRMADDSELADLSKLPADSQIPAGEMWTGSPASRFEFAAETDPSCPIGRPSLRRRFAYGFLYCLGVLFFPLLPMLAFFPGMVAMAHLNYLDEHYSYLVLSPFVATSFVLLISLEIVVVKWLLLGRVRPGTYPLYRSFYYRKWLVDRLLYLSLDVIGPLYSTLYLSPWYRLLGAENRSSNRNLDGLIRVS